MSTQEKQHASLVNPLNVLMIKSLMDKHHSIDSSWQRKLIKWPVIYKILLINLQALNLIIIKGVMSGAHDIQGSILILP